MIVSIIEKYRRLVEGLYTHTLNGNIDWVYHPAQDRISTSLANKNIILSETINDDIEASMVLTMLNPNNSRGESFSDEKISGTYPNIDGYASYWELMKALYDYGVRKATGADKDIDEILSELDDLIPF